MIQTIDNFIDSVTMYRSALYGLGWLALVSLLFSVTGTLSYSPLAMVGSLALLVAVNYILTVCLAKLYRVPFNYESSFITSLLLFFIMAIPTTTQDWVALIVASGIAVVSKYVLNWQGAHVFNPAAFGALIVTVLDVGLAGWWVATPVLVPFTLLVGAVLLRKMRKVRLFLLFTTFALILYLSRGVSLQMALLSFPVIFMGIFMLTEPSTSPMRSIHGKIYAMIVGVLSGLGLGFISSPQTALAIGNIYTFIVDRHRKTIATLIEKKQLAEDIFEWAFRTETNVPYQAGQYMEWTLPGVKFDQRGNRRTFTVIPGADAQTVRFATKLLPEKSVFKTSLDLLKPGDSILVGNVGGNFVVSKNFTEGIVGIAGGVGITPFVAIAHAMIRNKQQRNVMLYYFVANKEEVIYRHIFQQAKKYGFDLIVKVGNDTLHNHDLIGLRGKVVYISGPSGMVRHYKGVARKAGAKKVKTDYFAGY